MNYGDVVVIDRSRNLLLIMSNRRHITDCNEVKYLSFSKYSACCRRGKFYISNGVMCLQRVRRKLICVSILDTRLHGKEEIILLNVADYTRLVRDYRQSAMRYDILSM